MADFARRYEKGEILGEGTTARVFKGVDLYTHEPVAIKIAHNSLAKHNRFVQRWQREIALLGKLQHPRIVPLIDANAKHQNNLYMVMNYASGGSLQGRLFAGCLVRHVLNWLVQILEGLSHIHSYGVIHQDIKPDNILLTSDGNVWLADFSVARTRSELLLERQDITGTPEWYAPEQRMKIAAEIGPWTDLYAWGKILRQISSSVGYRSGELSVIIDGCLEIDPQQRFRSASEIIPLLQQAIEQLPSNILRRRLRLQEQPRQISILKNAFDFPDDLVPKWTKGISSNPQELLPNPLQIPRSLSLLALNNSWGIPQKIFQQLWKLTQEVLHEKRSKVVFIIGEPELGKRSMVRQFSRLLQERGIMDNRVLSYSKSSSFDDGYRGVIRKMLSPWGEDRSSFVQRLKRWLARANQSTMKSMEREAIALAKWSGFVEPNEPSVDNGLGLVFLFQHLQRLSWKGGISLVLENPEYCSVSGDGLDICETLLSGVLGKRAILLLCSVSQEYVEEHPEIQARMDALYKMGAHEIRLSKWSDKKIIAHIEQFCLVPEKHKEAVAAFCQGRITRAKMLLRSLAFRQLCTWNPIEGQFMITEKIIIPKMMDTFLDQHLQEALQWIDNIEDAKEVLAVLLCSHVRVDQSLVNAINSQGVNSLINVGLINQKDRYLYLSIPQMRPLLKEWLGNSMDFPKIHEKIALAWSTIAEKKGLRFDLEIGRSWLYAGYPNKAMGPLLLAVREARDSRLWVLTEQIAELIMKAAEQNNSLVGKIEGVLNQLEAQLGNGKLKEAEKCLLTIKKRRQLDRQTRGRVAYLEAELCIARKEWTQASQLLKQSQGWFADIVDTRGQVQAYMRQGYLLFVHNKLQRAADRFAQALRISQSDTLAWAETQARLVETRLRLGWMKGLHQEVEKFLKVAQQNADIHHMAYATYAAGLLLITQERRKEGLYRLQTAQALAASCGDDELLSQSLENQGFIYFLQEDWDRACFIQGKLIHFYNIRMLTDQKNVAQIRFHCAKEMVTTTTIATLELDNIEAHNEHVQYWWWIYHIVHYKSDAQEYWNKAKEVSVPKVWDLALYKMLDHLATLNYCSAIRVGILSELRDRFQQRFK